MTVTLGKNKKTQLLPPIESLHYSQFHSIKRKEMVAVNKDLTALRFHPTQHCRDHLYVNVNLLTCRVALLVPCCIL